MDAKIGADAMTSSVIIVQTNFPKCQASNRINLATVCAYGKLRVRYSNMTLQYPGKMLADLFGTIISSFNEDCSCHIGGSV